MGDIRRRHEAPAAIARLGWRYHHLGIPHGSPRPDERHLQQLGVHVCGFETSPYGIEWMRFDPQCPVPEVVKTVPHLAFSVDDLDAALEGREILIPPNSPSPGVRAAFILDDGAPIELLELEPRDRDRRQYGRTLSDGRGWREDANGAAAGIGIKGGAPC